MKRPTINKDKVIETQIKDIESFGVKLNDQQRRYIRSCMELVWINAERDGWWEAVEAEVRP